MIWLAQQGHHVIGVELSPIAVEAFFHENGLTPVKHRVGKFTLWRDGRITILCGDYFSMVKADLGEIDTVYDRAALTALPEDIRSLYITQLRVIVSATTNLFLLTTEDAEEDEPLSQALGVADEITSLYSKEFVINLAHVESLFEQDAESPNQPPIRVDYKVYRLTGRSE
jgi:thiopurine S-methyltransferase